jgi:hypothetical protein
MMLAAHHSYIEVSCPECSSTRVTRKDIYDRKQRVGEVFMCRSCAMKTRSVTWKRDPDTLCKNQGAYKSYCKAKRRVKTNHKNAYAQVQFRFSSYEEFLAEVGPRPTGMTLDRIDPMGHYEPGNVRWATVEQQAKNRNPRHTWTPKQETAGSSAKISTK